MLVMLAATPGVGVASVHRSGQLARAGGTLGRPSVPFCLASSAFILSRDQRRRSGAARALTSERNETDEKDEAFEVVWKIAKALVSLVPVAGPVSDAIDAAKEERLRDYCYHWLMVVCDITPPFLAFRAARMAKFTSRVSKLVRQGKKGYSLRAVAKAAKQLAESAEMAKKLTPELRLALKAIHKVCVSLQREPSPSREGAGSPPDSRGSI